MPVRPLCVCFVNTPFSGGRFHSTVAMSTGCKGPILLGSSEIAFRFAPGISRAGAPDGKHGLAKLLGRLKRHWELFGREKAHFAFIFAHRHYLSRLQGFWAWPTGARS
jgi:hypothetical protein